MSSMVLSGDTSGAVTLSVPAVAGTNTITVPAATGTMALTSNLPTVTEFKNRIINGAMMIDQRNAGASFTPASVGGFNYGTVDRWCEYVGGAVVPFQRVSSSVAGFPYQLQITGASSNNFVGLAQKIESYNSWDLVGQTITVSFWASCSSSSSLDVKLRYPTAQDNWSSTTDIADTVVGSLTSTMTKYSLTFTNMPSGVNNGLMLLLEFGSGLGSGVTFNITGVQLEVGSQATGFDYRDYGRELILCQRYFESTYPVGAAVGSSGMANYRVQMTIFPNYGYLTGYIPFKITKRATPSVTFYGYDGSINTWHQGRQGQTENAFTPAGILPTSDHVTWSQNGINTDSNVMYGLISASAEL